MSSACNDIALVSQFRLMKMLSQERQSPAIVTSVVTLLRCGVAFRLIGLYTEGTKEREERRGISYSVLEIRPPSRHSFSGVIDIKISRYNYV